MVFRVKSGSNATQRAMSNAVKNRIRTCAAVNLILMMHIAVSSPVICTWHITLCIYVILLLKCFSQYEKTTVSFSLTGFCSPKRILIFLITI